MVEKYNYNICSHYSVFEIINKRLMARATVSEIDKRLSSHEAACEQRWKENYRRLDLIEVELKSLNNSARSVLVFLVISLLGITGFFLNTTVF